MKFFAPLLLVCLWALPAAAQRLVISGQVVEATNGEPVPFASIFIPNTSTGVTADADGKFRLTVAAPADSIAASAMGFATQRRKLTDAPMQSVLFRMKPGGVALAEVVVSSRQPENPAFRILREVQKHKPENARTSLKAAEYDSYNRIETSLMDLPKSFAKRKAIQDIRALAQRQGAAAAADADAPLPIFASEVGSRVYQRTTPLRRREDLLHKQMRGAAPREGSILSQMLGSNFQNFDFYLNWQNVMGKDFISPIAEGGRLTYDYELQDSVFIGKDWCYRIAVKPRRAHDLAFRGTIWITSEHYALRRADLVASPDANLNFVSDLRVFQELTSPGDGPGLPTRTKMVVSVRPHEKRAAMLIRLTTVSSNFVRNLIHTESGFYDLPIVSSLMEPDAGNEASGLLSGLPQGGGGYFDQHRPDTLSLSERQNFAVLDSARELPSVRNVLDWVDLFVNGYKRVGKWDLGPIINSYSRNDFEGSRFRFGFRTTPEISRNWLTQAYVAYGTRDGRLKYGARTTYIAERQHWTLFNAEYRHDVEQAALLDNDFTGGGDNLFAAASRWGRFIQGRPILRDLYVLSAQRDLFHGFTQTATFRHQGITPLHDFAYFRTSDRSPTGRLGRNLSLTELVFESRYAPDEMQVQSENRRRPVGQKRLPVFLVRYTLGWRNVFEADATRPYQKFNVLVTHSTAVGVLGRLNYRVEGSYIPDAVPYLILKTPLGNQTPFYNANAFNLMNYLEFVTDRSVSLRLDQHFEGLILNSLPGIKKLNWRLVGTANILYGGLSSANSLQPSRDPEGHELPPVYSLSRQPYVEAGYGIENIFRFLRVDFLHRLTYRDQPRSDQRGAFEHQNFGIKFSAQFRL